MGLALLKFLNVATHFSVFPSFVNAGQYQLGGGATWFVNPVDPTSPRSNTEPGTQRPAQQAQTVVEYSFNIVSNNLTGADTATVELRQNGVTVATVTIGSGSGTGLIRVSGLNLNVAVADLINFRSVGVGATVMTIDNLTVLGKVALA